MDYVNSFLNDREFFHLKYLVVNSETGPEEIVIFHSSNESIHKDEDIVARELAQKVKVLCWIMTQPDNHKGKVRENDGQFLIFLYSTFKNNLWFKFGVQKGVL